MWDPEQVLSRMPARAWGVWERFYRKHPFGPMWDNFRAALAPWAAVNFNPFRSKDAKPVPVEEFIPDLTRERPDDSPATPDAAAARVNALAAAAGAEVIDLSRPLAD